MAVRGVNDKHIIKSMVEQKSIEDIYWTHFILAKNKNKNKKNSCKSEIYLATQSKWLLELTQSLPCPENQRCAIKHTCNTCRGIHYKELHFVTAIRL